MWFIPNNIPITSTKHDEQLQRFEFKFEFGFISRTRYIVWNGIRTHYVPHYLSLSVSPSLYICVCLCVCAEVLCALTNLHLQRCCGSASLCSFVLLSHAGVVPEVKVMNESCKEQHDSPWSHKRCPRALSSRQNFPSLRGNWVCVYINVWLCV